MGHHLTGRMNEYPLLIYSEWEYIDPDFKKDLLDYVQNGGSLLVIGPETAALFEDELNVKLSGEPEERVNGLEYGGWLAGIKSPFQKAELKNGAVPFGKIYLNNDIEGPYDIAASITQYGRGKIAAVYLNLGERYVNAGTSVSRDFLNALVSELFPDPIVDVTGSHYIDVTLNRKNGKLALNLVNPTGQHANDKMFVFDEIPPIGPLSVSIRSDKRPLKVTLEPGGKELYYNYINGKIVFTLPKLEIHDIIVVE